MNLISLLFSSISPILNKFSLVSLNAVVGGVLTSTFAATFNLILIMVTYKKVSIVKDKMVIILGATNAIGVLLQYIALSMLSPVTVTLIARIYLVYIFLLGGVFLKERIRGWDYVAIAACMPAQSWFPLGGRNLIPGSVSSVPLSTRSCTRPTT